jgi:hypothetical protein
MANAPAVNIVGAKEILKQLNTFDNKYRRQITKDIKATGEVIIHDARWLIKNFPNSLNNGAPLSGMVRGNIIKGRPTRWNNDLARAGFKIKVGQAAGKERYVTFKRTNEGVVTHDEQVAFGAKPYGLMVIQQVDPAGAIFDHAGIRGGSSRFVQNLQKEAGPAPRAIDIAVAKNRLQVTEDVRKILQRVTELMNRKIEAQSGN